MRRAAPYACEGRSQFAHLSPILTGGFRSGTLAATKEASNISRDLLQTLFTGDLTSMRRFTIILHTICFLGVGKVALIDALP